MKKEELISILIPVYNVESYIDKCMESVLNQTYKNTEIIVIDDGSSDNTYAKLKSFQKKDSRIVLFQNRTNQNVIKTLNFGLTKVQGNYILRVDGDDYMDLDRLEILYNFIIKYPKYDLVGTGATIVNTKGEHIGKVNRSAYKEELLSLSIRTPVIHHWLAKKNLYQELKYRNIIGSEDYDFILRVVTSNFRFTNIPHNYGSYILINRPGNTLDRYGGRIIEMKKAEYVYSLYKERLKHGYDTHSLKKMQNHFKASSFLLKTSKLASYFYINSNPFNFKKITHWIFRILSNISVYCLKYHLRVLKISILKLFINFKNKP